MRFVSVALLLVVATAHAENWQQIAKLDSNGGIVLVDVAAITEVKGLRRAWFKSIYTSDQPIPPEYLESVPKDVRTYRSEVTLRYFNCAERTSAVMRFYWNGVDDKAGGYFYQKLLTFRSVLPETLDEKMLEAACNFAGEFADPEAAKLHLPGDAAKIARITRPANPDVYYPSSSVRHKEQGSPVVQVCVGPRGAVLREPVVTESSGFPDLDQAAVKLARATGYAPGKEDGKPLAESCITFKVKFDIHGAGVP